MSNVLAKDIAIVLRYVISQHLQLSYMSQYARLSIDSTWNLHLNQFWLYKTRNYTNVISVFFMTVVNMFFEKGESEIRK